MDNKTSKLIKQSDRDWVLHPKEFLLPTLKALL